MMGGMTLELRDLLLILGTGVSVGGFLAAFGSFLMKAVIARDLKPITEALIETRAALSGLREALQRTDHDATEVAERMEKMVREVRDELRAAIASIQAALTGHGQRLAAVEARETLEPKPATSTRRRA
jgi:hypothetical protein